MSINRDGAIRLLEALPFSAPTLDPCHDANPPLWAIWCDLKGRDDVTSPSVWTEQDVVASSILLLCAHMRSIVHDE